MNRKLSELVDDINIRAQIAKELLFRVEGGNTVACKSSFK